MTINLLKNHAKYRILYGWLLIQWGWLLSREYLLRLALPALQRAAKNARDLAILHKNRLIIWQDDHIVKLSPAEIREQAGAYQTEWCWKALEHEEKNKAGKTANRLAANDKFPGFKVGGSWRFKREDVQHWIEENKVRSSRWYLIIKHLWRQSLRLSEWRRFISQESRWRIFWAIVM